MSVNPTLFEEVKLHPPDDGIGKKCYATAKITHETGTFPNKRYFTTNRLRYVGLYTRREQIKNTYRWYFQNPLTQEEIFFDMQNPLEQWTSPNSIAQNQNGFVEVVCYGNKIRSLQELSRGNIKNYLNSLSDNDKENFNITLNDNQPMYELIYPSTKYVEGGKKRKTRKGRRKNRKNRKMSRRRK